MYQQQVIGQTVPQQFTLMSPLQQARASGTVVEYQYQEIKPNRKLKELSKVLQAEPKQFLFFKYGKKFNLKDRCVVCGMHHVWEAGDYLRPPLPLDKVVKGRPMMGTYCPKHSAMFMQLEMLQQQILADKHGLEFKRFIPKVPKAMKSSPLKELRKEDVISLTAAGWFIKPPALADNKTATQEVMQLITEINLMTDRINHLMAKHKIEAEETKEE